MQFLVKDKKVFKVSNFVKHRSVRYINTDGTSSLNRFWAIKLNKFGFPVMGITEKKDKDKVISDLNKVLAAIPKATEEEKAKFVDKNKKFMALSVMEDGAVSEPSKSSKSSKSKPSKKAKKQKVLSKEKEDDSSSSEATVQTLDSDDDSEGSN